MQLENNHADEQYEAHDKPDFGSNVYAHSVGGT